MRTKIDHYSISETNKQRLKRLEKELLSLNGCSDVEWDLEYFYELKEAIFLVEYDIKVTMGNYFAPYESFHEAVIETARSFDLHKTPDPIEDFGRHFYFVFSVGKTWKIDGQRG